jgi:hypothetical protein
MIADLSRAQKGMDTQIAASAGIDAKINSLLKRLRQQAERLDKLHTLLRATVDSTAAEERKKAEQAKGAAYILREALRGTRAVGAGTWTPTASMLAMGELTGQLGALFGLRPGGAPAGGVDLTKLTTINSLKSELTTDNSALSGIAGGAASLTLAGLLTAGGGDALTWGGNRVLACPPPATSGMTEEQLLLILPDISSAGAAYSTVIRPAVYNAVGYVFGKVEDGVQWLGDRGDDALHTVLGDKKYNQMHEIYDSEPMGYVRNIVSDGLGFGTELFSMMGHAAMGDLPAVGMDIYKAANKFEGVLYQGGALLINRTGAMLEFFGVNVNYDNLRELEMDYAQVRTIEDAFRVEAEKQEGYNALTFTADTFELIDNGVRAYDTVKGGIKLYESTVNLTEFVKAGDWDSIKGELSKLSGFKSGGMTMEDLTYVNFDWNQVELGEHFKRVSNTYSNLNQLLKIRNGYMDGDLYKVSAPGKFGENVDKLRKYTDKMTD